MKEVNITQFIKNYSKILSKVPRAGIRITKDRQPIAYIYPALKKDLMKETAQKAKIAVMEKEMLQVDTFTQKEPPKPVKLGTCHRCGRHGRLIQRSYINEHETFVYGKHICLDYCFQGEKKGLKPLTRSSNKEVMVNNKDFGGSSVNTTF